MEKDIERFLVRGVRELGGMAIKFVSPGLIGVPDRILVMPGGRVIFVELKTINGKLSPMQQVMVRTLRGLGCDVRVLYGRTQVYDFLQELSR